MNPIPVNVIMFPMKSLTLAGFMIGVGIASAYYIGKRVGKLEKEKAA